jgi:hypothetical protein
MIILASGLALFGIAAILDSFLRLRMKRAGYKWALLEGGAFDYSKYHQERKQRGWSVWPVILMWGSVICGLSLVIAGFFILFGTSPTRPK